jgi:hypothetical protein
MGCGAGMNHRVSVMTPAAEAPYLPFRGSLFWCTGPVTNSQYPLVFNNLTFDGGLTNGLQSYNYWTLNQANGDGWDTSHDAVMDWSPGVDQMHQYKLFENCVFQHWRGEILKSSVASGGTNTFIVITNCTFTDGNASAFNLTFGHDIEGCTFSHLVKVLEFYQSYALTNCTFANNVWTNIVGNAFSIVGSVQNVISQPYLMANNDCTGIPNFDQITFSPAENVTISNNVFRGQSIGIAFTGVGLQPSDGTASYNSNIVITANNFNDTFLPIYMDGYPAMNVTVSKNTSAGTSRFASGSAYKMNIVFKGNTGAVLDSTGITAGNYFFDDVSDNLTPGSQDNDLVGITNALIYAAGRHHKFYTPTNAVYFLDMSNPNLIPVGATMLVERAAGQFAGPATIPVYASANLAGAPVQLATGQSATFYWTNGAWLTANQMQVPPPPGNLRIIQTGN